MSSGLGTLFVPREIVLILLLVCLCRWVQGCPDTCLCYRTSEGPTVRCNHQSLRRIPRVPSTTVVLDLRFNNISEVKRGDLAGLHYLTTLLLSNNAIQRFDPEAFHGLTSLRYLYLFSNRLRTLPRDVFRGLHNLEQLYLHFNDIQTIRADAFIGLGRLERLYIQHNRLRTVPRGLFKDLRLLRRLRLDSNELVCNCDLLWLSKLLRRTPNTETAATCHEPAELSGRAIVRLTPRELRCSPPKIVKFPSSIEVSVSSEVVSFKCKAVGTPAPQISWRKDRQPLPSDGRHVVRPDGTLDILRPQVEDEGNYECLARNDAGEQVTEASLRYYGRDAVPQLTRYPRAQVDTLEGNSVTLQCRAQGRPNPTIAWAKGGTPLDVHDPHMRATSAGDLYIVGVTSRDDGTYRCTASNKAGSVSASTRLVVTAAPYFITRPENTVELEGSTASLQCRAGGHPAPAIAWTKNGARLPSQDRHIVLPSGTLRILYLKHSDQGQYECQAINVIGVKLARSFLAVRARVPPSITDKPRDQNVRAGQTVNIFCVAVGAPDPVITWIKDNVQVTEGNRFSIADDGTLTIREANKGDEGRYQCAARNSVGVAMSDMILFVQGSTKFAGDKFVNRSIDQAISSVDRALKSSIRKLFRNTQPRSPSDLLALFRFPSPEAQQIARAAEVFERTIQLVHEHVADLEMVNVTSENGERNQHSFFDLLSPAYIKMIANLSGCSAHRRMNNCSDLCFHLNYRSTDGTCNNLQHPMWGGSLTPLKRLLRPIYENGFNAPIGWINKNARPSARLVSTELVAAANVTDDKKHTHMLMQWGQFLDHDMDFTVTSLSFSRFSDGADCTATCENQSPCFPIQIPDGDPRIRRARCMQFTRSSSVCGTGTTSVFFSKVTPREQMNQITAFIDASNIYGSSDEDARNLRDLRSKGLLKTSAPIEPNGKPLLPPHRDTPVECLQPHDSPVPCFLAGDHRANEQIGLLSMHTLWMREHNRIASELSRLNPHWTGEKIYHEARKIVGAQLQHITYSAWIPKIVGPKGMARLGPYPGYNPNTDPTIINAFATAAFRFGHGLIKPIINRLNSSFLPIPEGNIPLHKAFFSPYRIVNEGGIDPVLRGLFAEASKSRENSDELVNTELTERLFEMAHAVALDLGALNIQRGRDHALPGYNSWRKLCNLSVAESFDDLKNEISSADIRARLEKLYKDPSNVDLWLAGLLEDLEPGGQVGKVFSCILVEQFKRLRDGDRFWYENPSTFEPAQLTQIRMSSLARVLCDNGDNIQLVQRDVFLRAETHGGYVSCEAIPRMDLRMWKECCDEHCVGGDRTFTLTTGLKRRRKRSAQAENELEVSENIPPQSQHEPKKEPKINSQAEGLHVKEKEAEHIPEQSQTVALKKEEMHRQETVEKLPVNTSGLKVEDIPREPRIVEPASRESSDDELEIEVLEKSRNDENEKVEKQIELIHEKEHVEPEMRHVDQMEHSEESLKMAEKESKTNRDDRSGGNLEMRVQGLEESIKGLMEMVENMRETINTLKQQVRKTG
ncbi:peroxidasin [Nematostella vectensis]|uniref:peroxidasin n=1 Tax=Nematostella vectensis TaxID=45351 RepID=UPI0020771BA5|nr:peroxidasin [Nematostella vectensis]